MWSHYSDSHKGYCIELENTSSKSFLSRAQKVQYQRELPILNFFSESYLTQFLLTKSERWRYEKEWRIINVNGPGLYELPNKILSGIIFGCQMKEKNKNQIISWLAKSDKHVQLYQARLKNREFGLDIVPISND